MKTYTLLHKFNKFFYFLNLSLYITVYFGMLFQVLLGFAQISMALTLTFNRDELSKGTKERIRIYWILVAFTTILILLNLKYGNDLGDFIFLFLFPMLIATYFYYATANLHNDSFLTAEWNDLVMINYEIDPKILEKQIPKGTEIDFWNGKCYISLIGFMFENVKVLGMKIPFHVNFEEVNLRFYVKRFENGEWKRGVVFVKEIVPKHAITLVANTLYNEHYHTLKMRHSRTENGNTKRFVYEWKKDQKWNSIAMTTQKNAIPIEPESVTEFITEHYFGYTNYNSEKSIEYAVTHPKWEQLEVIEYSTDVDFENVYGQDFAFLQNVQPTSAFLALGSEITIEGKKTIQ